MLNYASYVLLLMVGIGLWLRVLGIAFTEPKEREEAWRKKYLLRSKIIASLMIPLALFAIYREATKPQTPVAATSAASEEEREFVDPAIEGKEIAAVLSQGLPRKNADGSTWVSTTYENAEIVFRYRFDKALSPEDKEALTKDFQNMVCAKESYKVVLARFPGRILVYDSAKPAVLNIKLEPSHCP
jgi:hypothetical protein